MCVSGYEAGYRKPDSFPSDLPPSIYKHRLSLPLSQWHACQFYPLHYVCPFSILLSLHQFTYSTKLMYFSRLHFQGFHQYLSYCNTGKPINFHCQAKEFSSKVWIIVLFCFVLFPGVPEPLRPWIQQPLHSTLIDLNPPVTSWDKNETKSALKCSHWFKDYFIMDWGKGCSTLLQ